MPAASANASQRAELVEHVGVQLGGRHVDPAAAEAGQVAVADLGADRDAAVGGSCADAAHGRRVAGVESARDVRAGHDVQQSLVVAEAPHAESLAKIGVQVDLHSVQGSAVRLSPDRCPAPGAVPSVPAQRSVVLLGSTGSIGTQAVDVVSRAPDRFRVVALAARGSDPWLLAEQAARLRVGAVGASDPRRRGSVTGRLAELWPADAGPLPRVITGPDATLRMAGLPADVVLNAVAGSQGLRATLAALDAGRTVALANKESLVAGGALVTGRAKPGQLVPVDSEHSALAQCLRGGTAGEVRRLS